MGVFIEILADIVYLFNEPLSLPLFRADDLWLFLLLSHFAFFYGWSFGALYMKLLDWLPVESLLLLF